MKKIIPVAFHLHESLHKDNGVWISVSPCESAARGGADGVKSRVDVMVGEGPKHFNENHT